MKMNEGLKNLFVKNKIKFEDEDDKINLQDIVTKIIGSNDQNNYTKRIVKKYDIGDTKHVTIGEFEKILKGTNKLSTKPYLELLEHQEGIPVDNDDMEGVVDAEVVDAGVVEEATDTDNGSENNNQLVKNNFPMFNDIIFHYVVDTDDKIWFKAKQMAIAFGYNDPKQALKDNVDDEFKMVFKEIKLGSVWKTPPHKNENNEKNTIYISEPGIYQFMASSKLNTPIVKQFRSWLFKEVLPSIRKTGSYQLKPIKYLTYDINNYKNSSVVYLLHVGENYFKYGITDDLKTRITIHMKDFGQNTNVVNLWILDNTNDIKTIETNLKNQVRVLKINTTYKGKTEIIQTNDVYDIDHIIDLIDKYIGQLNQDKNKLVPLDNQVKMKELDNIIKLEMEKTKQFESVEKTKQLESDNKTKLEIEKIKLDIEKIKYEMEIERERTKQLQIQLELDKAKQFKINLSPIDLPTNIPTNIYRTKPVRKPPIIL
jgi:prophage antirepressor-like protein/predicted GIY-YIG superfamily endonuclease